MRKITLAIILFLGLAVVTLSACGGGSGGVSGGSDESAVRTVIAQELAGLRNKDWRGIYDLHMHDSRYSCNYASFLAYVASPPDFNVIDTTKFDYADVSVSIEGETATATFVEKYDGTIEGVDIPDNNATRPYLKVNGSWYDASDPCGEIDGTAAQLTGSPTTKATSTPKSTPRATATPTPKRTTVASPPPSPRETTVLGARFAVVIDGVPSELRDATCTKKFPGLVEIENGEERFSMSSSSATATDGAQIEKGIIQFDIEGFHYVGNFVGSIAEDLRSGAFSGTFVNSGETAEVTGSFTC